MTPRGCAVDSSPNSVNWTCAFGKLAAGATKTIVVQVNAAAPVTPIFLPAVQITPATGYADSGHTLDQAQFDIVYE